LSVTPTTTSTYTLSCTGDGGTTTQSVQVSVTSTTPTTPAPTVTISASPTSITSGGSSTLTWSSTNATSCTASGSWTGSRGTSGTQSTGTLTTNSTFTLSCSGAGGTTNQSVTVIINSTTPVTPTSGGLEIDLSYVNQSSPEFIRFKSVVDAALAGNPDYGFSGEHAALMYKITGDVRYADYAIGFIENCQNSRYAGANCGVQGAEALISNGNRPPVAGDSYLEVGDIIGSLALVYDWAGSRMTQSQKTRWANYANQTIYNVWNPNQASWGGVSHPWTGWSINNPGNNYYYSFVQATMYWALATNDTTLLSFVRNQKLQPLVNYFNQIPGGGSLEGTGYGTAHMRMFHLYQVWKDSTGEDLANANSHLTDSIRLWLHQTTPNRAYYAPIGDLSRSSFPDLFDYHRRLVLEARNLTNNNSAKDTASWWLNNISVTQMSRRIDSQYDLLPKGINTSVAPNEPLSYRASGIGRVFARTGWDTNALWMSFAAGKYNESHAHQDQGSFTLANNAWLAVTNNIYTNSGIEQSTDYHNIIRFVQNGSVVPQREGTESVMTVNQLGTNGEVDVTGNITPAYGGSSAVQSWVRNIRFSGRKLTVNDGFSVAAGTQAIFQIHVPVQPVVSGNTITAGNLRVRVLVPASPTITVVNQGRYRIDISGGTNQYVVELSDQAITGTTIIPAPPVSGSPTTPTTPTTPAPTVTISASPTSITSGGSSTLTWSSTNATSCTASGSWTGSRGTSGTLSVTPTTTSTYTLSCTGIGGSINQSTTVTVNTVIPTTPASTLFTSGQRVQTTANLNVRATASSNGTLLGTQSTSALGTITGTSVYANSINWWNVNYDTGVDGWSSEQFLQNYVAPTTPTTPTAPTQPTTPSGTGSTFYPPINTSDTSDAPLINFAETWARNWNFGGHSVTTTNWSGWWDYSDTSYEPWLFDRASVGYYLYKRTNDSKWLDKFMSDFAWYRARIDANGFFTPTSYDDNKYAYVRPFLLYERQTGDNQYRSQALNIYNMWLREFSNTYSTSIGLWTEREIGLALEVAVDYYDLTGSQAALTRANALVTQWSVMSANNGGAPLHTVTQHEGGGGSQMITSPWMSALYFQAAYKLYALTGNTEVLQQISRYADWMEQYGYFSGNTVGVSSVPTAAYYLAGPNGPYTAETPSTGDFSHCLDISNMIKFAVVAKQALGESTTAVANRQAQLKTCAAYYFADATRTTTSLPRYRVNPARSFNWWVRSTVEYRTSGTNSTPIPTPTVTPTIPPTTTTPTTPTSGGAGGGSSAPSTPSTPVTPTTPSAGSGAGVGGGGGVQTPSLPSTGGGGTSSTPKPVITRNLSPGTKGTDVTQLQNFLISTGYLASGLNTGYYGNATKEAVQKYQCATLKLCSGTQTTNGYGVVGTKTRTALTTTNTPVQTITSTLTAEQRVAIQKQISDLLVVVAQLMEQLKAMQGN
jgi:hypothetical protein